VYIYTYYVYTYNIRHKCLYSLQQQTVPRVIEVFICDCVCVCVCVCTCTTITTIKTNRTHAREQCCVEWTIDGWRRFDERARVPAAADLDQFSVPARDNNYRVRRQWRRDKSTTCRDRICNSRNINVRRLYRVLNGNIFSVHYTTTTTIIIIIITLQPTRRDNSIYRRFRNQCD